VLAPELIEEADALPQQHGYDLDDELVDELGPERLLDDVRPHQVDLAALAPCGVPLSMPLVTKVKADETLSLGGGL
jgi:hypothetical protein